MRLLYIEDDAINRRVVRSMLETAGLALTEAEDSLSGLALIDSADFDLVLMDLRMPGVDGLDATRRIRARGDAKASVPIVVITADNGVGIRERCLAAGADEMLLKPLSMNALFDAIASALKKSAGAATRLA